MTKKMMLLGADGLVTTARGINKLRHRNGDWLRNDQGVGPAHYPGTNRGNERVYKKGHVSEDSDAQTGEHNVRPRTSGEEGSHVAGRVQGSVDPG
jgi:hypothetical protein